MAGSRRRDTLPRKQPIALATFQAEAISAEPAFEAAVSIALKSGVISHSAEASPEFSHFTASSYVLAASGGRTLLRFPRARIQKEQERLERINGNLESYRLSFWPGYRPVLVGLFLGAVALLAMRAWGNAIDERRLAAFEQSYLDHQASLDGGTVGLELAMLEPIDAFEARMMRARFHGCYGEVRDILARATDQLASVQTTGSQQATSLLRLNAQDAYEEFKASRQSCRQAMQRFLPLPFRS